MSYDAVFSPWYINTRRISDLTRTELSANAQVSIAHNDRWRRDAMHDAGRLARRLVASGKLRNLADCIIESDFAGQTVAGVWANARFRGITEAFQASEDGRPVKKPTMSIQVMVGDTSQWLDGELELEHYYSSSSTSYMSGQKQCYVAGLFELKTGQTRGTVHPWLVGDLLTPIDISGDFDVSAGLSANVYPGSIDSFAKMNDVRPPKPPRLTEIMLSISEEQVKFAFAEIIGEPFVPKDWAGERSDLYTNRLILNGVFTSAAFLLKGPSVPGPMHVANLGKRGDQIVRLFDEPAELLLLQHCNKIETSVVKLMRAFAIDPTRPRRFSVIDGASTYQILRAYDFIDKGGNFLK